MLSCVLSRIVNGTGHLYVQTFSLEHLAFYNPLKQPVSRQFDVSVIQIETLKKHADFLFTAVQIALNTTAREKHIPLQFVGCNTAAFNHNLLALLREIRVATVLHAIARMISAGALGSVVAFFISLINHAVLHDKATSHANKSTLSLLFDQCVDIEAVKTPVLHDVQLRLHRLVLHGLIFTLNHFTLVRLLSLGKKSSPRVNNFDDWHEYFLRLVARVVLFLGIVAGVVLNWHNLTNNIRSGKAIFLSLLFCTLTSNFDLETFRHFFN